MTFLETIGEEEAEGQVAELYEGERQFWGFVPNYAVVLALRPEVYSAWRQLNNSVKKGMDRRRYELATVTAAKRLKSTYCTMAHSRFLCDDFYDSETVRDMVVDRTSAGLDDVDVAIMDFAEQVADDAAAIRAEDIDRLRELGLTDVEIFDVALAAAVRCFFAKVLDATGAQPDHQLRDMLDPELVQATIVGRPVANE